MSRLLERQGWTVLGRNVRHTGYELDVVARKGTTLVVVEVKARRRSPASEQELAGLLPPRKRDALARGLAAAMTRWGEGIATARVDLAVVTAGGRVAYYAAVL